MHDPLTQKDHAVRANILRTDAHIVPGGASEDPDRWIQPHRLREHGASVAQPIDTLARRQVRVEIGFRTKPLGNVSALRDQQQRERQRVGDRFVPGEQQRQALVSHLPAPRGVLPAL